MTNTGSPKQTWNVAVSSKSIERLTTANYRFNKLTAQLRTVAGIPGAYMDSRIVVEALTEIGADLNAGHSFLKPLMNSYAPGKHGQPKPRFEQTETLGEIKKQIDAAFAVASCS